MPAGSEGRGDFGDNPGMTNTVSHSWLTPRRLMATSVVVGFGLQYPDGRCAVGWNEDPYHLRIFSDLDDARQTCEGDQVKLVWVDALEVP